MLCTFSFGCFQIYQNKSTKNIAICFIGTIVPIKCMPKISAVGLFCLDKFENNQTRTCTTFFRTSKLTEVQFSFKPLTICVRIISKKYYQKFSVKCLKLSIRKIRQTPGKTSCEKGCGGRQRPRYVR